MIRLAAIALFAATPAAAQQNCAPNRDAVMQVIEGRFGEARQAIGVVGDRAVVEVFSSTETGTWTIVVTTPNGATCILAAGEAFTLTAEAPKPNL